MSEVITRQSLRAEADLNWSAWLALTLVLLFVVAACAPRVGSPVPKGVTEADAGTASSYYWATLVADVGGGEKLRLLRDNVAAIPIESIPVASQQTLFDLCKASDQTPDVRIRACTQIIQLSQASQVSAAYVFRGIAFGDRSFTHDEKGDFQRARQDFRSAIRDFDQAILLDRTGRDRPFAYALRGVAKAMLGDKAGADADFATANTLNPKLGYPKGWRR